MALHDKVAWPGVEYFHDLQSLSSGPSYGRCRDEVTGMRQEVATAEPHTHRHTRTHTHTTVSMLKQKPSSQNPTMPKLNRTPVRIRPIMIGTAAHGRPSMLTPH